MASNRPLMLHDPADEQSCADAGSPGADVPRWLDRMAAGRPGSAVHRRAIRRSDRLRARAQRHRPDDVAQPLSPAANRPALCPGDDQHVRDVADRHARLPRARLSARLRDGAAQRRRRDHPSRRRRLELLDRVRGAHLCLAGDSRQQRAGRGALRLCRMGQAAAAAVHLVQLHARHDPRAAAIHGAGALRRHAEDRPLLSARRREFWVRAPSAHSASSSCRSACRAWSTAAFSSSRCASASTSRRSCSARPRT